MNIKSIMSQNVITINEDETIKNAVDAMVNANTGSVVICRNSIPIAIFTERDFLKRYNFEQFNKDEKVINYATRDPICISSSEDMEEVLNIMNKKNIRHLPVVENNKIIGIISIRDILVAKSRQLEMNIFENEKKMKEALSFYQKGQSEREKILLEENKRLNNEIIIDALTRIYNFNYFKLRLNEEILRAERFSHKVSLLFLDIDFFKNVNDTHGHESGNEVLIKIASIISLGCSSGDPAFRLRKTDIVARYGGEEFVVILLETPKNGALITADKIRRVIEQYQDWLPDKKIKITVSIGIAAYPDDALDMNELVQKADEAVYEAKHLGRNRSVSANPLNKINLNELSNDDKVNLLNECIENNLIYPVFQPVYNFRSNEVFGYEVFTRIRHTQLNFPKDLFNLAEVTGYQNILSNVLFNLIIDCIRCLDDSKKIFIILNNIFLKDLNFISSIVNGMNFKKYSDRIVFQIKLKKSQIRFDSIKECIKLIKGSNFKVTIDDSFCGAYGLNIISELEPEFIKFDMDLVRDIDKTVLKQNIVKGIIDFAQNSKKNILTIAEGIETDEEKKALMALGCDIMQGYLFGRPRADFILENNIDKNEK